MKINKLTYAILALICFSFTITSCSDSEDDIFDGPHFASFNLQSPSLSVNEDAGSQDISVGISQAQSTDVTLTLNVTNDSAIEGEDFTLSSSTVTIPAGEYVGSFTVYPIDNSVFNESKIFKVDIASVSGADMNIGNANVASYSKNIIIVNDDCPSQSNIWWGNINVEDVGYATTSGTGSSNDAGDCDVLWVYNDLPAGGAGEGPFALYFTPYFEGATSGTIDVPEQLYCSECSEGLDAYFSGSGTYDESTQTIIISYSLDRTDGANFWTGTNIITPAQ